MPDDVTYLDYGTSAKPRSRINGFVVILACAAIVALHSFLQFVLYRGRVINHWALADSDLIVFALPVSLSLVGFALLFFQCAKEKQWSLAGKVFYAVVMSLFFSFLSTGWSLIIPFNMYGT